MMTLPNAWRAAEAGTSVRAVAGMAGALLFYTSIDLYGHEVWGTPAPSLWTLVFLGIAAAIAVTQPRFIVRLARAPILPWVVGYFCVTTAWAAFMKDAPHVHQTLIDRYRSLALIAAFTVLFQEPLTRRASTLVLAAGVALASIINVGEALGLVRFADDDFRVLGRSGGFYVNSNSSGVTIIAGLAVVIARIPQKWRVPLLALGAAGVALTFSRSSVLAFGAMLVGLVLIRAVRIGPLFGAMLVAAGGILYFSADLTRLLEETGVLNSNTWSRLRLANDDSGRIEVARQAWQLFASAPLLGNGIGATSDWDFGLQTHNQYLYFGADHGVTGLLLLPAVAITLVLGDRRTLPLAIVLLLAGFFSHGLLFERPIILLIAFAGAVRAEDELLEDESAARIA